MEWYDGTIFSNKKLLFFKQIWCLQAHCSKERMDSAKFLPVKEMLHNETVFYQFYTLNLSAFQIVLSKYVSKHEFIYP